MRDVQAKHMQSGTIDISKIQFNEKSRDDIPRILRGLQYLYTDMTLRTQLFDLLDKEIAPHVDKKNGRPGMLLWNILVLGVLRLDLNEDYDRVLELANEHATLRLMLGHDSSDKHRYDLQTIKRNVTLLTVEILEKINQIVVDAGHTLLKKKTARRCMVVAIPLWLKQTSISQQISIYCSMRCENPYISLHISANAMDFLTGDKVSTIFDASRNLCVMRKTKNEVTPRTPHNSKNVRL